MKHTTLESFINDMTEDSFYTVQCASLCSLFISNSLISATIKQLAKELNKRHSNAMDPEAVEQNAQNAVEYGIKNGIFDMVNDKYIPTEMGWTIGRDWEQKLRLGWRF
jgi:hypothetical protein